MTDTSKYSNISVSKKTYSDLQRLSKEILPGDTNLSISKTVTHLVDCKIKESNDLLYLQGYQTEETGFTLRCLQAAPPQVVFFSEHVGTWAATAQVTASVQVLR